MTLRKLRGRAKMSQEKLALRAGLDRSFVSELESGEKQPTLNTIFQLARALNIMPGAMVDMAALFKFPLLNPGDSPWAEYLDDEPAG